MRMGRALADASLVPGARRSRRRSAACRGRARDLGPSRLAGRTCDRARALADAFRLAPTRPPATRRPRPPPAAAADRRRSRRARSRSVSTALAAALDRLVVRDDGANPLGAGDWRAARAAIGAFYAARGFAPVWVDADGLTRGRPGRDRADRARPRGRPRPVPLPALPRDLAARSTRSALAAAEVAVAAAVVAYAEQASGSRIAPSRVSPIFAARPDVADPGEALAETAAAADPGARLADFNPPQKGYRALRDALKRTSTRESAGARGSPPRSAPTRPTSPTTRSTARRQDRGKPQKAAKSRRSATLASAAAAARSAAARERAAILANMEMWRWEPRDMGERRIEVNIPDFSVDGHGRRRGRDERAGHRRQAGHADAGVLRPHALRADQSVVAGARIRSSGRRSCRGSATSTRLGYEVKTVGGRVSCASRRATATRSDGSPSCSRTTMRSICTTRRRASCSPRTCGR